MRQFTWAVYFSFAGAVWGAPDRLATIRADLQQLAVDPSQTWRVRDLELSRGGAKIYFSEGVLAFATPVDGRRVAAIFTTTAVEAGDAEVIALPPLSAERASLARFTHTPNLDEHFTSALLYFPGDIGDDLIRQIHEHPLHPAPNLAPQIADSLGHSLRQGAAEIDVRITQAILDRHVAGSSFFYCMMAGRTLGPFDLIFQPNQPDPLVVGRIVGKSEKQSYFQVWSAFRSSSAPQPALSYQLTDYHIDTTIHPDLAMSSSADFDYLADADDGAVIALLLSPRLRVTSASIDGQSAAVLIHDSPLTTDVRGSATFLLVNGTELTPGTHHRVSIQYEGSVIRRTRDAGYFVDDRNAWYPFVEPTLTMFDLVFRCPENLRLMSTGDLISEVVANGQRMVHRHTLVAQALAGFNLGEFSVTSSDRPPYHIEICSNSSVTPVPDLADQTARILEYYSARWMPLSGHSVAVTPIEGYFGQGFPGLIYLSSLSYLQEGDRPARLRSAKFDSFFSQLLLPHELAHQWWGNIVIPTDYHSSWIAEAMSNYAAFQYLEQVEGRAVLNALIADYRNDLISPRANGELVDSYGPVTFGQRLLNNFDQAVWHDILYEKGTWIFHMLRMRMGDGAFHEFQLRLLKDFAKRPISNEDLRQVAALFIPQSQPDRQLTAFFDTWVLDTGIPGLSINGGNLRLTDVPETFTVDVPLQCRSGAAPTWLRATQGDTPLPSRNCTLPSPAQFLFRD